MKVIRINRLWHGNASVRDYLVADARNNKEGMIIDCQGEKMTIPFERLDEGTKASVKFKSQHNGLDYGLIDYKWIPDAREKTLF